MFFPSFYSTEYYNGSINSKYMTEEQIGFNELVRRLNVSPTRDSKIQSGVYCNTERQKGLLEELLTLFNNLFDKWYKGQ